MPIALRKEVSSLDSADDAAIKEGRALRKKVPRSFQAIWEPSLRRTDPLTTLVTTSQNRLRPLLPLRYGRMAQSPFAFMRGSPAMVAANLAATPLTGIIVQACGDCHLGNFGAYASPERRVLFDINDFDETTPAPWEFDLKRLATSFTLVARLQDQNRGTANDVTRTLVSSYRTHLNEFAAMSPFDMWHFIIDSELLIRTAPDQASRRRREKFEQKERARTGENLLVRLLVMRGEQLQFKQQFPTLTRLRRNSKLERSFRTVLARYPLSLADDRRGWRI